MKIMPDLRLLNNRNNNIRTRGPQPKTKGLSRHLLLSTRYLLYRFITLSIVFQIFAQF